MMNLILNIFLLAFVVLYNCYSIDVESKILNNLISLNDTLSPQIRGIEGDAINVKKAIELDSIRIYDDRFIKLKIDSFKLKVFSYNEPADNYVFKGNIAPNIFKKYQLYELDENNIEQTDYIGFSYVVYYSDLRKRVYESKPKMVYFSVLRN
jgi:hypothetical protein